MSATIASALARRPSSSWAICASIGVGALEHRARGLLDPADVLRRLGVGARAGVASVVLGLVTQAGRAPSCARCSISPALRSAASTIVADLLGGGAGDARRLGRPLLRLAAEVLDGVRELAEVLVDLVRVVAAAGGGEVLTGDVSAFELHGREAYSPIGRMITRSAAASPEFELPSRNPTRPTSRSYGPW